MINIHTRTDGWKGAKFQLSIVCFYLAGWFLWGCLLSVNNLEEKATAQNSFHTRPGV